MKAKSFFSNAKAKFFIISTVFFGPVFLFMIAWTFYSNISMRNKLIESNFGTLSIYYSQIEDAVSQIEYSLSNVIANDNSFRGMLYPLDRLEVYLNLYNLGEKLEVIENASNYADALFIYSTEFDMYSYAFSKNMTQEQKNEFISYMKQALQNVGENRSGFQLMQIEDNYYVVKIMGAKNVYAVCAVNLEYLSVKYHDGGYLFFSDGENLLSLKKEPELKNLTVKKGNHINYKSGRGKYLLVQDYSDKFGIYIVYAFPYSGLLTTVGEPMIFAFASCLFMGLMVLYFKLLTNSFLRPLKQMLSTIESIDANDEETSMVIESNLKEFSIITAAFNKMLVRIRELRILAYDRKIMAQKAQLEYYQIQIRPHFFLNCLKTIYGMAESGRYDKIQDMIIEFSSYLRSMFRGNVDMVSIAREVEMVETYIRLQQICSAMAPVYECEITPGIEKIQIPPMSILTFVENSIHYAGKEGESIHIFVKVTLLDDEQKKMINITISDNGNGFDQKTLERINSGDFSDTGEHIGIYNVMQRFYLIYGDEAVFLFHNQKGAYVDIFIPCREV